MLNRQKRRLTDDFSRQKCKGFPAGEVLKAASEYLAEILLYSYGLGSQGESTKLTVQNVSVELTRSRRSQRTATACESYTSQQPLALIAVRTWIHQLLSPFLSFRPSAASTTSPSTHLVAFGDCILFISVEGKFMLTCRHLLCTLWDIGQ